MNRVSRVFSDGDLRCCSLSDYNMALEWRSFYIRAGKNLPAHATEVVVRFRRPPVTLFDEITDEPANYIRFRLGPDITIGIGARRKASGEKMRGEAVELTALDDGLGDMAPYERLIGDAMAGDRQLFTRQDAAELAWKIVEPVLKDKTVPLPTNRNLGACRYGGLYAPRRLGRSRLSLWRITNDAAN